MQRILRTALAAATLLWPILHAAAQDKAAAKAIYDGSCSACHGTGLLGAPKLGDRAQWAVRGAKGGIDGLVASATAGTAKGMPPKGGRVDLTSAQLRSVIEYMMGGSAATVTAAAASVAPVAKPAAKPVENATAKPPVAKPESKAAASPVPSAPATTVVGILATASAV